MNINCFTTQLTPCHQLKLNLPQGCEIFLRMLGNDATLKKLRKKQVQKNLEELEMSDNQIKLVF